MYRLIEENYDRVLSHISPEHVSNYDWLSENANRPQDTDFQARFRKFWALNAARLGEQYCIEFFNRLEAATADKVDLEKLVRQLYDVPFNNRQQRRLQFSFATKLLHMRRPHSPIYDSRVAAFYFFSPPDYGRSFDERISRFLTFYQFLETEYARVLECKLLEQSIAQFREQCKPAHFTDQKVIDSLIWGFVSLLRSGEVASGTVRFS